jgi:tetratricopeptide (TPR) repeat protein
MNAGRPMADYDRLCVQSWIACGFKILALNGRDEIAPLLARYPEIEFIAAERSAKEIFGRDTPLIADMASILAARPEPVLGIINCDVLFEPLPAWQNLETVVARRTIITGQRLDVRTLAGGALHPYFPGFDYFFFDRTAAAALSKMDHPFSLGLPWWDYWCPLILALSGYDLRSIVRPAVLHLAHDARTDARSENWRRLAIIFARSLAQHPDAACHTQSEWQDLIELCRSLIDASDGEIERGALDEKIIHLSELAVPIIGGSPTQLEVRSARSSREASVPAIFFQDIPNRVAAGHALHQAMWEENHGHPEAAHSLYGTALQNAPEDPGVLSACGNFLFRRGDTERAAILLEMATKRAPDSAMLLNSLGSALGQMGRDEDALKSFERALQADPLDGTSYYNLALALHPSGRHSEIIARLEQRLRDTPDFPDGIRWLHRIREKLQLGSP